MHTDPYQAPQARLDENEAVAAEVDADRRAHLRREAAVRTIGAVCLVVAVASFALGGTGLALELADGANDRFGLGLAIFLLAIGLVGVPAGWGLAKLQPWAKLPAAAFAVLMLPFCVTLVVVTVAAVLVFGARGRRVLAPDYADVRARTPHLRARMEAGEAIAVLALLALHAMGTAVLVAFTPGI